MTADSDWLSAQEARDAIRTAGLVFNNGTLFHLREKSPAAYRDVTPPTAKRSVYLYSRAALGEFIAAARIRSNNHHLEVPPPGPAHEQQLAESREQVETLERVLGLTTAELRDERFTNLQRQLDTARTENDRLRAELEQSRALAARLGAMLSEIVGLATTPSSR